MTGSSQIFGNYRLLVSRVEDLCRKIGEVYPDGVTCRKGCDGCCRHLSLFPVEAAALAAALRAAPEEPARLIRRKLEESRGDELPCPLLHDHACLLYEDRPVICRTHGLPILTVQDGKNRIDFCPLNFRGVTSFPGDAVILLDRLNTTLAAVNHLFVQMVFTGSPPPDRIPMADMLRIFS